MDILDASPRAFLYDTVAKSRHELAFFRHGYRMPQAFTGDDVIIVSQTILDELKFNEDTGRYREFLRQFPRIIVIDERSIIRYFYELYTPKQRAQNHYKNCTIRSFQTIQDLAHSLRQTEPGDIEKKAFDLYLTYFAEGKNKGEYSLLWLSVMLREIFPNLSITFIGLDRDLYHLVDNTYFRYHDLGSEIRSRHNVQILSDDSMLQALLRRGEPIDALVDAYRDENRKVLYKEISHGITASTITESSFNNSLFLNELKQGRIEVIY
ncbi:hypothetical protein B5M42_020385 [Paenibacillus athensensis]|uniref:Uncharacterized protein n=1 Tax=Paenibacillus athensensis TaxID=1967502 RepID=A0A4Y8Q0C4_9BACL|nr:hypothetical protein [Paenibacillus athensensis]MCD1261164.1 hypothetical protein [Paenibacillus athensensis]